jgi:hypothetical protein
MKKTTDSRCWILHSTLDVGVQPPARERFRSWTFLCFTIDNRPSTTNHPRAAASAGGSATNFSEISAFSNL